MGEVLCRDARVAVNHESGRTMGPCEREQSAFSLLYVEDDEFARKITCKLISLGFPDLVIHQAENGQVGLDLFQKHRPDIVISDINMPVMDGIRMAKKIRAISPHTNIIVVTAHNDEMYLDAIRGMRIFHRVAKPINHKRLFEAIEACCATVCTGQQR
jgi:YesN/AraC family two-component response regulator